jgi:hypothetical protein
VYGVVLILVALPLLAIGIYQAATGRGWVMLAAGGISVVILAAAWPLLRTLEAAQAARARALSSFADPLNERMQQMNVLLNQISEQQLISDRTKQVAYRTRDREAVRRAIHEEMEARDFEAALMLVNSMEQLYGNKQEAQRLRGEIEQRRSAETRKLVAEAVSGVERHIRTERWQEALAEAHRVAQAFPNDEQAHNLPGWVEERRAAHKRQLTESWHDAINRRDIDGSIEILRKLDPYLTPQETEAMQEPARNLFKEKLNSLRTQLSLAIQDGHWREALNLSETIIRDFPNTRIAQEVRERMDELRQRVAGTAETAATPA